jgi:hypothetical protein
MCDGGCARWEVGGRERFQISVFRSQDGYETVGRVTCSAGACAACRTRRDGVSGLSGWSDLFGFVG